MDTCGNCGAETGDLSFCTRCGASIRPTSGEAESPTTVISGDSDDSLSSEVGPGAQQESDEEGRRSRRPPVWLLVTVLVAVLGAIGAFLFVRNTQQANARESAVVAAATSVADTMTDLSAARTTADIRAVATAASEQQSIVAANTEVDPSIASSAQALGAIAALEVIDGDTLNQWPAQRAKIDSAVRAIQVDGTTMDPGPVLSAVDTNVANAQQALDTWQLQVNVIKKEQADANAALNAYEPSATAALDSYKNLRNSTAKWLSDAQKATSLNVSSATSYLQDAVDDRQDVRDSLTRLDPPDKLTGVHNEVVASLDLGIDGMESLLRGMSALSGCSGSSCTLSRNSGYSSFLSASGTNTTRYNQAYEAWNDAVAELRAQIESMSVPTKPVV